MNTCATTNAEPSRRADDDRAAQQPVSNDGTVDFANDLEPTPATADAGLQFLTPDSNGCQLQPTGDQRLQAPARVGHPEAERRPAPTRSPAARH